eukprot:TRINITY_DN49055_c0_g1_i1.p2 TRINITY_DN49055_c0_g1~~TRINITY_DN49055_c0_g1_i1.p2  ORF type:complete len:522 (+),score=34.73 TRINITY_DN49055_c0_g1_i1:168-1568(+)
MRTLTHHPLTKLELVQVPEPHRSKFGATQPVLHWFAEVTAVVNGKPGKHLAIVTHVAFAILSCDAKPKFRCVANVTSINTLVIDSAQFMTMFLNNAEYDIKFQVSGGGGSAADLVDVLTKLYKALTRGCDLNIERTDAHKRQPQLKHDHKTTLVPTEIWSLKALAVQALSYDRLLAGSSTPTRRSNQMSNQASTYSNPNSPREEHHDHHVYHHGSPQTTTPQPQTQHIYYNQQPNPSPRNSPSPTPMQRNYPTHQPQAMAAPTIVSDHSPTTSPQNSPPRFNLNLQDVQLQREKDELQLQMDILRRQNEEMRQQLLTRQNADKTLSENLAGYRDGVNMRNDQLEVQVRNLQEQLTIEREENKMKDEALRLSQQNALAAQPQEIHCTHHVVNNGLEHQVSELQAALSEKDRQLEDKERHLTRARQLLRTAYRRQLEELSCIRHQFQYYDNKIVNHIERSYAGSPGLH